jgi:hypothetical protein
LQVAELVHCMVQKVEPSLHCAQIPDWQSLPDWQASP